MEPEPQFHSPGTGALQGQSQYQISQQQTVPQPIVTVPLTPASTNDVVPAATQTIKRKLSRIFAIFLTLVLAVAIFFIWHSPSATSTTPGITQQNLNGPSSQFDVRQRRYSGLRGRGHQTSGGLHIAGGCTSLPTAASCRRSITQCKPRGAESGCEIDRWRRSLCFSHR